MQAKKGDRIIIESERVGVPERVGDVLEVVEHDPRTEFVVRWEDGHESSIRPAAGSYRIESARSPATA